MVKKRGLLLISLALVMAIAAAYTANRWVSSQVVGKQDINGSHVVAAAMSIPYGTKVESRHVRYVEVPEEAAPPGAFTAMDDIVGAVAVVDISRGEVLIANRFSAHDTGSTLAALVSENMRALTVRVNDVIGVAGFLLPGNRVDILASRKIGNQRAETETILEDIKVLAVDQSAATNSNEPIIVRAVTLEMTPDDAEVLVTARTEGTIQLTLRNPLEKHPEPKPEPEIIVKPQPVIAKAPVKRKKDSTMVTVIRGTKVKSTKTKT